MGRRRAAGESVVGEGHKGMMRRGTGQLRPRTTLSLHVRSPPPPQVLEAHGVSTAAVNLDPANDAAPYKAAIDLSDLVSLSEVQERLGLGPNGGLVYCLEYLEANVDWLEERLSALREEGRYVILDLPGQAELWSGHPSLPRILDRLTSHRGELRLRLVTVHLVDALLCRDAPRLVGSLLLCLSAMVHVELPHVNVLSKTDLLDAAEDDVATGVRGGGGVLTRRDFRDILACRSGLPALARRLGVDQGAMGERYALLTDALLEAVEEHGLVDLIPLSVDDPRSVLAVLSQCHRAVGFDPSKAPLADG